MIENLTLKLVKKLITVSPTRSGRPSHVSAASGLVLKSKQIFTVADDESALAVFSLNNNELGHFIPLNDSILPLDTKERKKLKLDLESLCLVNVKSFPTGLLLMPSLSQPNRTRGYFLEMDSNNNPVKKIEFDLTDFLEGLKISSPNIEGIVCQNDDLILFQRGNSREGQDALLILSTVEFLNEIMTKQKVSSSVLKSIKPVDLGATQGVKLTFTDACAFGDKLLYLSAAEDTASTYDDGVFVGSQLGLMDLNGQIEKRFQLDIPHKPEGLAVDENQKTAYIVTDADDFSIPSLLYEGTLCKF